MTWDTHPAHFWMRGGTFGQPVEFHQDWGMFDTYGYWHVFGYPEVRQVLTDAATFTGDTDGVLPKELADRFPDDALSTLDGEEHRKIRKLVSHAFTPAIVAGLAPRIRTLANDILDGVGDRFDLVEELAYPLPVTVIAELLGVPSEDRALFRQWADEAIGGSDDNDTQNDTPNDTQNDTPSIRDYFLGYVEDRRKQPRDDLLTLLLRAEADGDRLTDDQIVSFASLVLHAGHITTTSLIGNTVLCLDANPDAADRVREDRSLVPAVIEESLRFLSPLAATDRVTSADANVGGTTIPAGQIIKVWLGAANRDPRQFADPDVFDLTRDPNPHLAFGRGVHFCLGAPLARLEGAIVLDVLLERLPELRVEAPPEFLPHPDFVSPRSIRTFRG
ncbi:cytochrome P450 [Fodinicola acaciae]|uniref:cytochrome P450 n=1 Tax=Fodinicola acaciae TaxID=2681555 RepID=UPI0013CFC28C|nr:cytochrome P450 [Fodinicola acaciae]